MSLNERIHGGKEKHRMDVSLTQRRNSLNP